MKKILLDTNFLLIPPTLHVDIFSEIERICDFSYELCVLDRSMEELENIAERGKTKEAKAASIALQLARHKHLKVLKTETHKNADTLIVETANSADFLVATQDMALKRKLKQNKVPLIYLRQKMYLKIG